MTRVPFLTSSRVMAHQRKQKTRVGQCAFKTSPFTCLKKVPIAHQSALEIGSIRSHRLVAAGMNAAGPAKGRKAAPRGHAPLRVSLTWQAC